MNYQGDYSVGSTVYIPFNTFSSDDPSASVTITDLANTDVHIHKNNDTTQRNNAAGITVSLNFDTITGNHLIVIDTADNTVADFWVGGADYFVRIEGATVDGATINAFVGHFSLENRRVAGELISTTIATLASQTSFTLTAGSADDNAYNNCIAIVSDQVSAVQKCIGRISDYTGATKTVTLAADPAIFTIAAKDNITIIATSALANVSSVGGTAQTANDNGADINEILTDTGTTLENRLIAIEADTNELQTDDIPGTLATIAAYLDTEIAAILEDTGTTLPATLGTLATAAKLLAYVQLLARSDAAIETDNATELTEINADGGSGAGDFSAQTDSGEAIKDHIGDGTNLTEAGGDGDHLTEAGGDGDHLTAINLPNQTMDIIGNITGNLSGSVGSVTGAVGSVTGAVGSVAGNVDGNVTGTVGELAAQAKLDVNAEVDTAIETYKLDHLVAVADADDPVNDSIVAKLAASDGDWSGFDKTTDALEALRDRGDAAWAAGAASPTLLLDAEVDAVTSQTEFTLETGSDEDDAYNDQAIVLYDDSNNNYPSIRKITDYVGATKTVTINSGADFTLAADDSVKIFVTAPGTTAPTVEEVRAEMDSNSTQLAAIVEDTGETLPLKIDNLNDVSIEEIGDEVEAVLDDMDIVDQAALDYGLATLADQVNDEVVDALNVDEYSEPGQEDPPATASLVTKIGYLFKAWRNPKTVASGVFSLYNDAGDTVDQKNTMTDDGTTFTDGKIEGGP